ncbi:MAG TPA: ABC transporter permease [Gemmatimonadota bacterium]|nr:ABC transporter permease [Gemmatimonadota bacterium]
MSRTWTIVKREFVATTRTKGFVFGTLFGPAILAAWILLPALFAEGGGTRDVVVIDGTRTGLGEAVAARLAEDAGDLAFRARVVAPAPGTADSVRQAFAARAVAGEIHGYVWLPPGLPAGENASYEARHATNMREVGRVRSAVDDAVRQARLKAAGIDPGTLSAALAPAPFVAHEVDAGGRGAANSGETMVLVSIIAVFVIYFVILLYGNNVLRAVREEKENRVVEIVLSSIRAEQLMAGKVFGIGGASLLQVAIWVAVAVLVSAVGEDLVRSIGGQVPTIPRLPASAAFIYLGFFAGGFFLYASIYAALGAMATSGQDAQSLQFAAMLPLMIAFFMAFGVMNDPEGKLAVVGSLIPLTSLIVVPLRAILGAIPWTQTLASAALLAATCWATLWIGGRVYRVTILATGQRPSLRRVWRWVRTS